MNLPSNVKPLPKFFSKFNFKGFTSMPLKKIYLRKEIFEDLRTNNPNYQNISVLIHERAHLKRTGKLSIFKYLFSPKFRLREELIAYKEQFKYLKKHNLNYDLDNVAKHLGINYQKAKKIINQIWNNA